MQKKVLALASLVLVVCVVMMGCASTGREMTQDKLSLIKAGETTKSQMIALFGPPVGQGYDASGKMQMTWHYSHVGAFGSGVRVQSMAVLFDESEVVEKYSITDNKDAGPRWGR